MRFYRDNHYRGLARDSVVTIGNYDGVHKGHLALIRRCLEHARDGRETALVTFEPLPLALFAPERAPARLTSVRQKLQLIEASGIDLVWMMRFNRALAGMEAREFVHEVLVRGLSVSRLVIGDDFRFGRGREGSLELLRELGAEFGFEVEAIPAVLDGEDRVSSTRIRQALAAGDFTAAEQFLGRPFCMEGRVVMGGQLGRKLGYPTANIRPAELPSPLSGVFAVQARVRTGDDNGSWMNGVANLGVRPVVDGKEFLVEVHVFDFDGDLYGQRLEVRFVSKLRDEQNFENLQALVDQMQRDEAQARKALHVAV